MDRNVGFPWSLVQSEAEGKTKRIGMKRVIRRDMLCGDGVYRSWKEEGKWRCEMAYVPFSK
jgi:hypothetical protein